MTSLVARFRPLQAAPPGLHAPKKAYFPEHGMQGALLEIAMTTSFQPMEESGDTPHYLLHLLQDGERYQLKLVGLYKDATKEYLVNISPRDANHLLEFYRDAMSTTEPFDPVAIGLDGEMYFFYLPGAPTERAFTWSPNPFTYAREVTALTDLVWHKVHARPDSTFHLSPAERDMLVLAALTPDSMRDRYFKKYYAARPEAYSAESTVRTVKMRQKLELDFSTEQAALLEPRPVRESSQPTADEVAVYGMVYQPGKILYYPDMRLSDAIRHTGGVNEQARTRSVYVVRQVGEKKQAIEVDFRAIQAGSAEDFTLRGGEVIYIRDIIF
ncbi:MAG: SLBB domain-containing protein [Verrucomicrobiota bacterium]